ncbi:MAG: nuclear transport factor 2 family protein [Acaryochloridaceae cyanobacterium CSU_3_4]|nr:nuclear transport factor 2 family protein [Acaryochloridaceae cyanobacterium CSU_3_4]
MMQSTPSVFQQQIMDVEEQLRLAMLSADIEALENLLADDLIFTSHLGQVVSKQDDLAFHRAGVFKFQEIKPSERQIQARERLAIVSVRVWLTGIYNESPFQNDLRYTRIWCRATNSTWQVVAGHSSPVQESAYFPKPQGN